MNEQEKAQAEYEKLKLDPKLAPVLARYEKMNAATKAVQLATSTVQCAAKDERLTDEQRTDIYNAVHNELYCRASMAFLTLIAEAYMDEAQHHLFHIVLATALQMAQEKHSAAFSKAHTLVELLRDQDTSANSKPSPWGERVEQSGG